MAYIYETKNFIVEAPDRPLVSRLDGGHIRIGCKDGSITDRTKLDPKTAVELMRLSMLIGEAMETALTKQGIPIVKINYQDMGNWAYKAGKLPTLHIHVFGRSKDAVYQPFPESVNLPDRSTGFYECFEPLNNEDIGAIQREVSTLVTEEKYAEHNWELVSSLK